MPTNNAFHSSLMKTAGIPDYKSIPKLATWKGDVSLSIMKVPNRLKMFVIEERARPQTGNALIQSESYSRIAGGLTNSTVVDAAINRYEAGAEHVGAPNNQIAQAVLGSLLVDIYTVTGQFMRSIMRNEPLRTDNDCALFPLYRSLHFAAADAFGKVFGINGEEIDVCLRNQLIFMSTHGVNVDTTVGSRMWSDEAGIATSQLAYVSNEEALGLKLDVQEGKLMISVRGNRELFDCSGPVYRDITRGVNGKYTRMANPARRGTEKNGGKGVAGFAMALNRNIYASIHSNYPAAKGSFYHSCYLEGNEVLCAGCITVVAGELRYINNWSGHYKPSLHQLLLAVQALRARGVDLSRTTVEYQQADKSYVHTGAEDFLSSLGSGGKDFDAYFAKGRVVATAVKVRKALEDYEKRTKKGWFPTSAKSQYNLRTLKTIHDDETLVQEVRFLLGKGGSVSPLHTTESRRYSRDEKGQLYIKLNEAMADLEKD